jgi:molecular chaperone GrpE
MSEEEKTETPIPVPEEDFKDKYFRTLAEMQNMTKRMQKEKHEMIKFGIENAISDFLPVIDNFETALRFAEQGSPEVKNWAIGFQMFLSQLKEALHVNGIAPFASVGTLFDPSRHEAVEIVETEETADGTILAEFTKGYQSPNRVIRPARVKVAKAPVKVEMAAEETLTK